MITFPVKVFSKFLTECFGSLFPLEFGKCGPEWKIIDELGDLGGNILVEISSGK